MSDLDAEVTRWRSLTFADSTKTTYSTHLRSFLRFCERYNLQAIPASSATIGRYAAYLARDKTYATVTQYLNIVRIIHVEFGLSNPLDNNWFVRTVFMGIKRGKGLRSTVTYPLLPCHLHIMKERLDLTTLEDQQLWAAILCAFFGLLRVSNVTDTHPILRKNIALTSEGFVLTITSSKTIQHANRSHPVVLPYIENSAICPVAAMSAFLAATPSCPLEAPVFAIPPPLRVGPATPLTAAAFRRRLAALTAACPSLPRCTTHSLRKGGATWLLSCGVPLSAIRIIGDWASDCVYHYLLPDARSRFNLIQPSIHCIRSY